PKNEKQTEQKENNKKEESKSKKSHQEKMIAIIESNASKEDKVKKLLNEMSLEEKIGQLFVVCFQTDNPTEQPNDDVKDMLENKYAGGVILFDRNMTTKKQIKHQKKKKQKTTKDKKKILLSFIYFN